MLLAIDPGTRKLGWAVFYGELLVECGISETKEKALAPQIAAHRKNLETVYGGLNMVETVAVEQMFCRPGDRRSQPNDLLNVQAVGFALAGTYGANILALPAMAWKGSIPKDIHQERIRRTLKAQETRALDEALMGMAKKKQSDVVDAVGIGLAALGRKLK